MAPPLPNGDAGQTDLGQVHPGAFDCGLHETGTLGAEAARVRDRGPAFARQLIERLDAVGRNALRERNVRVVGKRLAEGERALVERLVHLAELAFATLDADVDDVCRGENLNLAGCNFDRSEAAGHRPRLLDRRIGFGFERPWREDGYV